LEEASQSRHQSASARIFEGGEPGQTFAPEWWILEIPERERGMRRRRISLENPRVRERHEFPQYRFSDQANQRKHNATGDFIFGKARHILYGFVF
jgi:hypothetical protein